MFKSAFTFISAKFEGAETRIEAAVLPQAIGCIALLRNWLCGFRVECSNRPERLNLTKLI